MRQETKKSAFLQKVREYEKDLKDYTGEGKHRSLIIIALDKEAAREGDGQPITIATYGYGYILAQSMAAFAGHPETKILFKVARQMRRRAKIREIFGLDKTKNQ